jgi:hypothetical protein
MGFPAIYSSDQGREFVNSVMSSLIEKTNAVHRISTAYHPQTYKDDAIVSLSYQG